MASAARGESAYADRTAAARADNPVVDHDGRRRALVEAGIALTSELSLDAVLDKLVRTAAELTNARYAALVILDRSGQRLTRFLTHGLTQA